jgi:pimeloyl-ACP methyl ester carboxylesterase
MRRLLLLALVPAVAPAQPPSTRAKANIEALEAVLPAAEKAADAAEKDVAAFAASRDDHVLNAIDGARLRIAAVRSVRRIIATQPDYLAYHVPASAVGQWTAGLDHFLAAARAGADPFRGKTSGVRTVRSPVDGQLLFYAFRLPKGYDPSKRYPLDVALHSGGGLTWAAGWVDGPPSDDPNRAAADDRVWISPCGRGNNSYAGMGEVAVMDAVRDALKRYSVDPDRVTVGGASMGGTGGFRLAALHPDVFAAAHSLTGGANYSVPVGDGRYDATLLLDNFCNTAMCIWDATNEGWFKQNRAFADGLRERAKRYPGSYPVLELTDPKGGHGVIDRALQAEGWEWIRKQRRDPLPRRVVYQTYNLRYDGAYWVRVERVADAAKPARIEAEVGAGGKVTVKTENVERFRLDLSAKLIGDGSRPAVSVDGGPAVAAKPDAATRFFKEKDGWVAGDPPGPDGPAKRHGLSGPIQDVFLGGPVLLVHGGKDGAGTMLDAAVLRLFGPGDGDRTLHAAFDRKAAADVTAADIADRHLVLFGTPEQNALVAKVADRLPAKFLADGVEAGGKAYRGEGVGLALVYPNPLNPDRYVLLLPEGYAGGSPLDLPDYVVGKRVEAGRKVSWQVLAKGSFDARWK